MFARSLLAAACLLITQTAHAAEPFEHPTADGVAKLRGQIDWPSTNVDKHAAVVLVAGTGLFDRRMLVGTSNTPRDFVFDDLAAAITAKGIAVVRYDYRGVSCSTREPTIAAEPDLAKRQELFAARCIDNDVRATVTPETNLADVSTITAAARAHPRIDPARVALLGVSEGTLYIGRLLARDPDAAKAVFLIGPPLESPKTLLAWQQTDRITDALNAMMSDPTRLTADDIRAKHATSRLQLFPLNNLLPKGDAWTAADLEARKLNREKVFAAARQAALLNADDAPYPGSGAVVLASYRWWNSFHRDDTPIIHHYAAFKGPVHLLIGDKDSQVDVTRQKAALAQSSLASAPNITWHVYAGKGHLLGDHALLAPMTETIRDDLAARIAVALAR